MSKFLKKRLELLQERVRSSLGHAIWRIRHITWKDIFQGAQGLIILLVFGFLAPFAVIGLIALFGSGYIVFRGSSSSFTPFPIIVDLGLIASLWIAELPIGILFYRLFEQRRSKITEAVEKADARSKYSHLRLLYYNFWREGTYYTGNYIVNLKKNTIYVAPDDMVTLADEELISKDEYWTRGQIRGIIKRNHWDTANIKREPKGKELDP